MSLQTEHELPLPNPAAQEIIGAQLPCIVVSARGLLLRAGKILLVERSGKSIHNAFKFELPGGKRDTDPHSGRPESIEEAIIREVGEETGLVVKGVSHPQHVEDHQIDGGHRNGGLSMTFAAVVTDFEGTVELDAESSAYGWFDPDGLPPNMTDVSRQAIVAWQSGQLQ